MIISWTKHLQTEEEKKNFERQFHNAADVLERLAEILTEEETALTQSENTTKQYDNPNWTYLQADKNGYRRAISIVKKLINLDQ